MAGKLKSLISDRQNLFVTSSVFCAAAILFASSLGPFVLYILGILTSAILGICIYCTLRLRFSSPYRSFIKYPGNDLNIGRGGGSGGYSDLFLEVLSSIPTNNKFFF